MRGFSVGCDAIAIFSASPRVWKRRVPDDTSIARFTKARMETRISIVILHAPYLVNLASTSHHLIERSVHTMLHEIHFAAEYGIEWIVLHPGSSTDGKMLTATKRVASHLNRLFERTEHLSSVKIALETTSGSGTDVGGKFEYLGEILMDLNNSNRIGICLDTCHVFASGYDVRNHLVWQDTYRRLINTTGIDKPALLHLNDSQGDLNSHLDRHEHIGKGKIGLDGFKAILSDSRLSGVPMILETPKDKAGSFDKENLKTLRALLNEIS